MKRTFMMPNAIGVDAAMSPIYVHHEVSCAPRHWSDVAEQIQNSSYFKNSDGHAFLYGIWRSQIGLPRDVLTMISVWPDIKTASLRSDDILSGLKFIKSHTTKLLAPTLRPKTSELPVKQGNYAFRWFETPKENYDKFLQLCEEAWPSFESSFDSQVIGLWQQKLIDKDSVSTLLLTRRPNLSMWERSKIPKTMEEKATREKLSRRYDLCDHTIVYTTTLITALDAKDNVNWS
ncbi:hypothetical protein N9T26_01990 [Alphaproteobacteria bacterium]|jgi:hypothetical protein|nr:hypothetical protein [Alphaproteobacteria bacterium]|tara:strand:- start:63 stop:761 length:699 start_codon:yes stop_codon:yes gene_type:complete